jgi:hypothetical protein
MESKPFSVRLNDPQKARLAIEADRRKKLAGGVLVSVSAVLVRLAEERLDQIEMAVQEEKR